MIPVTVLDFHINTEAGFDLGQAPGSALRGALYAALRTMYDTNQPVASRDALQENPAGWLLRLEDEESSGGKDVPRPIAIRPPVDTTSNRLNFGLAFYGQARQTIPMVVSAIPAMGQIGVGPGRKHFSADGVSVVDPLSKQPTLFLNSEGQQIGQIPESPGETAYMRLAALLKQDQLTVNFLTPTRIVDGKKLTNKPIFRAWMHRLLGRIRSISEVYTDSPLWVPFTELLELAEQVSITEDNTRWRDSWSGSRRDGMVKPLGGFVGKVTYSGPLTRLLPYILLGQALQVGKNTIKGCGWYDVWYEWAL